MNKLALTLAMAGVAAAQTTTVKIKDVTQHVSVAATAAAPEPGRAVVESRFPGWVESVRVDSPFAVVREGEPLCVVTSPELKADEADYLAASAYAQSLAGGEAAASGKLLLAAARQRLTQKQVPEEEQERLIRTGKASDRLTLRAPRAGVVMARNAVPQLRVEPGMALFSLGTLDPIWLYAHVPESQMSAVAVGGRANVQLDAFPGHNYHGTIEAIEPQVASETRTVPVRIAVDNPDHTILPGMSGVAEWVRDLGRHLTVPASAVLQTGEAAIAFVDAGGGQKERRTLRLGAHVGNDFIVLGGLRPGERVATQAPFLLDAEAQLSASAGTYAPPPPGVATGAASPAVKVKIELTTDPSPARKGKNTVRVRLAPTIEDAEVSTTFFMPAMPAMGMAEMKTTVTLAPRGAGFYEGDISLASGGVWRVTVAVHRGGKLVASQQLEVRATGGM